MYFYIYTMYIKNYTQYTNESNSGYEDFDYSAFIRTIDAIKGHLNIEIEEYGDDVIEYKYIPPFNADLHRLPIDGGGYIVYDFKFDIIDDKNSDIMNLIRIFAKKFEFEMVAGNKEYLTGPYTRTLIRFKTKSPEKLL